MRPTRCLGLDDEASHLQVARGVVLPEGLAPRRENASPSWNCEFYADAGLSFIAAQVFVVIDLLISLAVADADMEGH